MQWKYYLKKGSKLIGWSFLFFFVIFLVLCLIPERELVSPIQPKSNTQYWKMAAGFKLAYIHLESTDESNSTPVIYLHGGPGGYIHSSIVKTLEPLTQEGHDVFLYDQRGSGLSERLPRFSDVSFSKHLEDLHEIITQKLKAEKVILIGQSYGSNIIAHFSAYHPALIEKLIFSAPGGLDPYRMHNDQFVDLESLFPIPDTLNFIEPYNFVKDVDKVAMKPKAIVAVTGAMLLDKKLISDRQMDRILNNLAATFTRGMVCDTKNVLPEEGGGGLYAYLGGNFGDIPDVRDRLSKLEIPVMVLQGQCDYIPFSHAYEYVDLYPISQYKFIENAGHEIWWEQRKEYLNQIQTFLSE